MLRGLVFTAAGVALLVALPAGAGSSAETLRGFVGGESTIQLTKADGGSVSRLDSGAYTVEVQDTSDEHNFHLRGPGGVDEETSVEEIESVTWNVTLVDGTYTFLCDPHPRTMTRTFRVGAPAVAAVRLAGAVGPGSTISLKKGGAVVKSLPAGAYTIAVRDRTTAGNFHLVGPGANRKTSVPRTQSIVWSLALKAGSYTYRSDTNPKLKGAFKVTA